MPTPKRRARGLTHRVLSSGLLQTFGLDALGLIALAAIGVSVYRVAPDLVWGYAGGLMLLAWWAIGRSSATPKGPSA
jgi:hypothetical protein